MLSDAVTVGPIMSDVYSVVDSYTVVDASDMDVSYTVVDGPHIDDSYRVVEAHTVVDGPHMDDSYSMVESGFTPSPGATPGRGEAKLREATAKSAANVFIMVE